MNKPSYMQYDYYFHFPTQPFLVFEYSPPGHSMSLYKLPSFRNYLHIATLKWVW